MREIEFRAFDKDNNCFAPNLENIEEYCDDVFNVFMASLKDCQNSLILSQYTGLKDKNNRKIFEGDIIRWVFLDKPERTIIEEVVWDNTMARFKIRNNKLDFYWLSAVQMEVIGNIYQDYYLINNQH